MCKIYFVLFGSVSVFYNFIDKKLGFGSERVWFKLSLKKCFGSDIIVSYYSCDS